MDWGPGDCFLIQTYFDLGGSKAAHLFVIVLEWEEHTRNTIIVNIDTLQRKSDHTTILDRGDHEFIKHPSFVNYRKARIISSLELEGMLNSGIAKPKPSFTNEIFQRICEGILRSRFTPAEVREMYEDHLFNR
jgi:hypothetical protein